MLCTAVPTSAVATALNALLSLGREAAAEIACGASSAREAPVERGLQRIAALAVKYAQKSLQVAMVMRVLESEFLSEKPSRSLL